MLFTLFLRTSNRLWRVFFCGPELSSGKFVPIQMCVQHFENAGQHLPILLRQFALNSGDCLWLITDGGRKAVRNRKTSRWRGDRTLSTKRIGVLLGRTLFAV